MRCALATLLLLPAGACLAAADLGITISAAPTTINVGQTTTLTVVGTNAGPDNAATATTALSIPLGLAWQSVNCNRAGSGNPPQIWSATLAAGQSVTCTIVASADGSATGTRDGSVSFSPVDSNFDNNSAGYSVTINAPPASVNLALLKGASADAATANNTSMATVTVQTITIFANGFETP